MDVTEKCMICDAPATQRCMECNQVSFCTDAHRVDAWQEHEPDCKPFKVLKDPVLGRYLVATRDIKPGEVILQEIPLIKGPSQITAPVCLGCYRLISSDHHTPCMKCGWPMCAVLCAQYRDHIPECTYTVNKGNKINISNFIFPHPNYQCLIILRCLYQKEHNKEIWDKLMSLDSHCKEREGTEKYESDRVTIAQFIKNFYKLEDKFTEEEILKVCGIVQVNGHEVPLTEPPFVAIYSECSMFEHNCKANCSKSFTSDWEVLVTASVPISEGEHLSISYTDSLWGTQNRRHYLQQTKFFDCNCERCSDNTEFGTNFSSIKCQNKDCKGYMLPDTFLVSPEIEEKQIWKCNMCDNQMTSKSVQNILDRIGRDLQAMQKGDAKSCQMFLDYYGKLLHPNHFYMTDVRLALSQLIGQDCENGLQMITDDELNTKLTSCKDIIDLSKKLNPAEVRVRGVQLFELHATLAELGRRRTSSGQISSDELTSLLIQSKRILEESLSLLKFESEEMPEGKIAQQAEENLEGLNNLLADIATNNAICPL